MIEKERGESYEPKLPPRVAMYMRVAKAKEKLEDEIYGRAEGIVLNDQYLKDERKKRVPEQTIRTRKQVGLEMAYCNEPKINIDGNLMSIQYVQSNVVPSRDELADSGLLGIYLYDSHIEHPQIVLLHPEMPPLLVEGSTLFDDIFCRNPWISPAELLREIKFSRSVDPSIARELIDDECELISSAIEGYRVPDELVSGTAEAIYQNCFEEYE